MTPMALSSISWDRWAALTACEVFQFSKHCGSTLSFVSLLSRNAILLPRLPPVRGVEGRLKHSLGEGLVPI